MILFLQIRQQLKIRFKFQIYQNVYFIFSFLSIIDNI